MREPNLKALKMFDAAAQHLNFRLAAESLHLTQGAVAQQVRQLEADLNMKLFHRLPRGLALTPRGAQYYEAINHALYLIEEATRAMTEAGNSVTVSVTPSMAAKWLVPRLSQFEEVHPDIDLHVVASEAIADFQADGVDIAIRYGRPPFEKSLHVEHLADIQLLAVCSPEYAQRHCVKHSSDPVKKYRVDNPEVFVTQRLIQDSHGHWGDWFNTMKLQPTGRMLAFNQTALAIDAAINKQGITLVPALLVRDHLDNGDLVCLWCLPTTDEYGYYLVYPARDSAPDVAVVAVQKWLRETLSNDGDF